MLFTFSLIGYCLAILVLFIIFPKIKRNVGSLAVCIVAVFTFLLLVYFRPPFFRDTEGYANAYKLVQWNYLRNIDLWAKEPNTYTEYGFVFIELIFKTFGFSFPLFSVCIALFTIISIYFLCNTCYEYLDGDRVERKHFFTYYAIYLSYFGLLYNFVTIRSGLSFALLSIAAYFAIKKKPIKMLIFLLIAFSIHRLSIIAVIPLLLLTIDRFLLKKSQFLTMWIVLVVAWGIERSSHLLLNTVGLYVQNLYNNMVHIGFYNFSNFLVSSITTTVQCFVYIVNGFIYYYNYQEEEHYSSFSIIYLLSMAALSVTSTSAVFYRVVDYLYLFSIPVNYYCYINWKKSRFSRTVCLFSLTLLSVLVWGKNFLYWYLYD